LEEVGTTLDKVCLSGDGEERGGVLLPTQIVAIGEDGGEVAFDCTRRG